MNEVEDAVIVEQEEQVNQQTLFEALAEMLNIPEEKLKNFETLFRHVHRRESRYFPKYRR